MLNYLSCPTEAINEENISVIDTLAHVDFTVEAFSSVLILDNDVVDGLQSHPIADDKQKVTYQNPIPVFIKNLDQPGGN